MSVTLFSFLAFILGTCALYFIIPKRFRWMLLLAASFVYYALTDLKSLAFILVTMTSVYVSARAMEKINLQGEQARAEAADRAEKKAIRTRTKKKKRRVLLAALLLNFGILGVLKYTVFVLSMFGLSMPNLGFFGNAAGTNFLLPLGVSFYTFQALGYVIDVYYGKVEAEKNFARFALFVSFFPQIIQGPISRFDQLAPQLYEGHDFDFTRAKRGLELMLWGYIKKLVVADRLYLSIWNIIDNWEKFSGLGILTAMLFYCVELYADFSGGIDISRGVCQIMGIELTPNFRQPFYATSISEFWRRWHITLGSWVRDYIFYPIATSRPYVRLQQRLRNHMTSEMAERVCMALTSLLTFLIIGIWHGAAWAYVIYGLWYGGLVAVSSLLGGVYDRFHKITHIPADCYPWKLFQRTRTFVIVILSFYLLLPPTPALSWAMLVKTFTDLELTQAAFHKVLTKLVFRKQFPVAVIGTLLIMLISALTEHGVDVRKALEKLPFPIEWAILLAGVLFVVIFGFYGAEYDGTSFIYQVF